MYDAAKDVLGCAKLAPLLDRLSDGVFVVDRDRRICLFNPAAERITGVRAQDALGRTCHSIFTGFDEVLECAVSRRPCTISSVFDSGNPCSFVDSHVTFPDGTRRTLSLDAVPLFDEGGGVVRVAMILHDVSELRELRHELKGRYEFHNIVGKNHRMQEIYDLIEQIADTDATVLIEGESGTGKELVARAIHFRSRRSGKPFVQVNCSALVETLLESELFGHVRGAFTGAVRDNVGRFEAANGGTIFLDEIGDISPAVQVKLLRVVQERHFERVGDNTPRATDVRIITATHRNLRELMQSGRFREDLYYRLRVVPIWLPPLRERREDIPLLVDAFIKRFASSMRKPITAVSRAALARMMDYGWPGNVRELENAIEHAFVKCSGDEIQLADLPIELRAAPEETHLSPARSVAAAGTPVQTLRPAVEDERAIILAALRAANGNKSLAASRLGVGRTTLWRRMKELGIATSPRRKAFRDGTLATPNVPF